MTRKQHKCQYVQEQGVIFSRCFFVFFFSQLGKAQQCMGNKIFSVIFLSPKIWLKHKGYLFVFWMREKKNEEGSSEKGARCVLLSSTCPTARLWVSGPETSPMSCPCSLPFFPHLPFGMCPLWMGTHRGLWPSPIENNNLNSWPWCSYCSYMFCFPQRQDRTDDCRYFKMSAWHCGMSII